MVEKDSEIKRGCYRGSGGTLLFFTFLKFFQEAKMGVPPRLVKMMNAKMKTTKTDLLSNIDKPNQNQIYKPNTDETSLQEQF